MMLGQLTRLCPPPLRDEQEPAWGAVEEALGVPLPTDYKALVAIYGPGLWGGFLHLFQPNHPNRHIDLVSQVRRKREVYEQLLAGGELLRFPLSELMAAGVTDNGDVLFWHRRSIAEPDSWHVRPSSWMF